MVAKFNASNPNITYKDKKQNKVTSVTILKCLDLYCFFPDISFLKDYKKYCRLSNYFEAITNPIESQTVFFEGRSYCSGKCVAAVAIQKVVTPVSKRRTRMLNITCLIVRHQVKNSVHLLNQSV